MLKDRIIGVVIVREGLVVQSIGFSKYLPIGKPEIAVEFLNYWGIDEIILLDIGASTNNRLPDFNLIKRVSQKCFVPLTYGGGISSVETMKKIVKYGADKISINYGALTDLEIIKQGSLALGNQCIVISMDVQKVDGRYEVYMLNGKKATGLDPVAWAKLCEQNGAGEIIVNSIERDGSKNGYDLNLIQQISSKISIPLIVLGGVGHPQHLVDGLGSGATAVAAANFFHFSEHSPITAKSFLKQYYNMPVRHDTYFNYNEASFSRGRIQKQSEEYLQKIKFKFVPPEVI